MNTRSSNIDTYGDANTRIKIDALGIAVFVCGATASINLNLIGEVYGAELLLILVALAIMVFRGSNGVIASHSFHAFLLVGLVTLGGYMISDIYVGTLASQYLRGWGRVGLLISNVLCLMLVVGQGRRYLWWFIFGMGVGGVIYLAVTGLPFSVWKLGYGENVSFIVLAIACVLPRRLAVSLLVAFGILNIALDYRNFAAVYLIVAGILWMRSGSTLQKVAGFKGYFMLGVGAALAITVLLVGLSMTEAEYGARRADSNVGRMAGIVVAMRAVANSPIIGYGSWTVNEEYARMLQEEQAKNLDPNRARRAQSYDVKLFRAHSQILQPWVEAGIFGAAFFLYYGYRLVTGLKKYVLDKPIDRFSPINFYFPILALWHLVASPFGGEARILIAVAVTVLVAIEFDDRRRPVSAIADDSLDGDRGKEVLLDSSEGRILRRRRLVR